MYTSYIPTELCAFHFTFYYKLSVIYCAQKVRKECFLLQFIGEIFRCQFPSKGKAKLELRVYGWTLMSLCNTGTTVLKKNDCNTL